jgi:hypothetical protein
VVAQSREVWGKLRVASSEHGVSSFVDENVPQLTGQWLYDSVNILKTIELHIFNGKILRNVNSTTIKLLKRKEKNELKHF